MELEEIKQWALENKKGLIAGFVIGFVIRGLLK